MKTTVKTSTATTARGTQINITATAVYGCELATETAYADGYNVDVKREKVTESTEICLVFNGKKLIGTITKRRPSPSTPIFFGYFLGNDDKTVMPFDKEVYSIIERCKEDAEAEARTDESYVSYIERKESSMKEEMEYYSHVKAVESMMTLNGKTY